jgi:phosphatidylglycerophosphatase C
MPKYAFFDFDGTLISQDSFLYLLKTGLRQEPWRLVFLLCVSPVVILTFLFKLNKTVAKSCVLWSLTVFRGKRATLAFFHKTMSEMVSQVWFEQALGQLESLREQGVEIVIVSASGLPWIRSLLRHRFREAKLIIGTRTRFFCGGVICASWNCYQEKKLLRIEELLGSNFEWHSAWSDHIADLPMLKKAPLRYIISPKKKHLKIFDRELDQNYTLLNWTSKSTQPTMNDENFTKTNLGQICFPNEEEQARAAPVSQHGTGCVYKKIHEEAESKR